ncbi:MAG: hypothetical protein K2X66_07975 [Cyanobacteria bacterium]|nr:hypothetical protein [Cyanobacteriota bacterium]
MAFTEDLFSSSSSPESLQSLPSAFFHPSTVESRASRAMRNRVNLIATHMVKQLKEHEEALKNTNQVFYQLLDELEDICECFRESFALRDIPGSRIGYEMDADRSVGILNVLWNAISFTTRGNTKPLALNRNGRAPVFTGRIVALHGDFLDSSSDLQDQEYPSILQYEIASLYVPADKTSPAVMTIKHLGDQEHFLHQTDASRLFLLKTVEMICGGGFFHEKEY